MLFYLVCFTDPSDWSMTKRFVQQSLLTGKPSDKEWTIDVPIGSHTFRSRLSKAWPQWATGEFGFLKKFCLLSKRLFQRSRPFKLENPSLNSGGGLRHFLSPTWNALLRSLLQRSKCSHLHTGSCDSSPCDHADEGKPPQAKLGQRPCQRLSWPPGSLAC